MRTDQTNVARKKKQHQRNPKMRSVSLCGRKSVEFADDDKPKPKRKLPDAGLKKRQKLGVPTPEPFMRSIG